jgi:hypothetical protein
MSRKTAAARQQPQDNSRKSGTIQTRHDQAISIVAGHGSDGVLAGGRRCRVAAYRQQLAIAASPANVVALKAGHGIAVVGQTLCRRPNAATCRSSCAMTEAEVLDALIGPIVRLRG